MAVVPYTQTRDATFGNDVQVITWTPLAKGDTGTPFKNPGWADRSVQITGSFDTATITIEGSNDGTTYFTLTDPQTTSISKTSAALEQVIENTLWIRPNVAGSGGTTALTVVLVARKP